MEHRFAEERSAKGEPIEATHEVVPAPHLDAMGLASMVQLAVGANHRLGNPRASLPASNGGGTSGHYRTKTMIDGEPIVSTASFLL